jgi:Leucine-rich repeat (LRR) protein
MEWVAQLPRLESLSLEYTPVTDTGFAKLAALTSLSELHLDHTEITDASVKGLTSLRNLKYVDVYHTSISEQGFNSLHKALPACRINWSLDAARRERRT